MVAEGDDRGRARRPADVGPTDARLTSGIRDDAESGSRADHIPRISAADEGDNDVGNGDEGTPAWGASARIVLAGTLFVAFGTYLAVTATDSEGLSFYVVIAGLVLALYGFITWPRSRNVS